MFGRSKIADIGPDEIAPRREAGAVLVDVREDDEWAAGHAPNAVHVPLGQIGEAIERLHGREVMIVCRSGGRSAKAARVLADAGVEAVNVAGGMTAWVGAGLPVVRDDGTPGSVI